MAFVPTPFTTPVVAVNTYQAYREAPYLTPLQYRFAPTSVATGALVPGTTDPEASTAALAGAIDRASSWIDDHVYHGGDGSLVGSITVEQMTVTPKPDGSLVLLANLKPIRQLIGLAVGTDPSSLSNLDSVSAQSITLGEKSITVPYYGLSGSPMGYVGTWPSNASGQVYCVYSYVAGYPHATLAEPCAAGATSLVVNPPVNGAATMYGAFAGTSLTVNDGPYTEQVFLASAPNGLTLTLSQPTVYSHTPPAAPDGIMVTALPSSVTQACISMTNLLIKTQGFRAMQLPGSIGGASPLQTQAMARAGALGDFQLACELLAPYRTSFFH